MNDSAPETIRGSTDDPRSTARIGVPNRASLAAATAELLDLATRPDGTVLATVGVLAHRPALVGPFLG